MSRLLRWLEPLVGSILGVMALLVVYQVLARYLLGSPPSWTEELARYLQVWLVLLGAPICLARGMHLAIDYLTSLLPFRLRVLTRTAVLVLVGLFSLILGVYGVRLLRVAALQVSPALGISMVWPYVAVPVSGFLMTIEAVALIIVGQRQVGVKGQDAG